MRDTNEIERKVKMDEREKWERREKGEKSTERQIQRESWEGVREGWEGSEEGNLSSLELCPRHAGIHLQPVHQISAASYHLEPSG